MSHTITPAMIKELRERTGVGMGKCKEALEAANGNMDLAIENLRKAGMATAVKKEGRSTNEGIVASAENGKVFALVEVNAETDFVTKNDRFQQFARDVAQEIVETLPASLEAFRNQKFSKDKSQTVEEFRAGLVQAIGENIQIKRLLTIPKASNKSIAVYSHLGGKLVTVVEITGASGEEQLAKDIAMHIAASAPEYITEKDVPAAIIAQEREIAKSQIKGKPENIVDKIVDGKVSAYYDANCLVRQKYIKNDALTVGELVEQKAKAIGKPLTITSFLRWNVGQ